MQTSTKEAQAAGVPEGIIQCLTPKHTNSARYQRCLLAKELQNLTNSPNLIAITSLKFARSTIWSEHLS